MSVSRRSVPQMVQVQPDALGTPAACGRETPSSAADWGTCWGLTLQAGSRSRVTSDGVPGPRREPLATDRSMFASPGEVDLVHLRRLVDDVADESRRRPARRRPSTPGRSPETGAEPTEEGGQGLPHACHRHVALGSVAASASGTARMRVIRERPRRASTCQARLGFPARRAPRSAAPTRLRDPALSRRRGPRPRPRQRRYAHRR
jgi:hypothetical protein